MYFGSKTEALIGSLLKDFTMIVSMFTFLLNFNEEGIIIINREYFISICKNMIIAFVVFSVTNYMDTKFKQDV